MSKVVMEITLSLDGLICGPGDDMNVIHDWMFNNVDARDTAATADMRDGYGAVIMGRGTFDDGVRQQGWAGWVETPPFSMPMFVLSHDVPDTLAEGKTAFTLVNGIENVLQRAKAAAGDKAVLVMGGANMVQQYLNAGLLDELYIHHVPILLGAGKRLFENLAARNLILEQVSVVATQRVTHIRYRINR